MDIAPPDMRLTPLARGRYLARAAVAPGEIEAALALRSEAFRQGADDRDPFDARCRHVIVEDRASGGIVGTFRAALYGNGAAVASGYSAQFYDLAGLAAFNAPLIELGRFCMRPGCADAHVLRIAWAALARMVDDAGVGLIFGCSSFAGTDAEPYRDAFDLLRDRHLGPARWLPKPKASSVHPFAQRAAEPANLRRGQQALPPLLRSYLSMGGWVSDHAVVDRDLGTLHVFTGLEIAAIPPARARALRAMAVVDPAA